MWSVLGYCVRTVVKARVGVRVWAWDELGNDPPLLKVIWAPIETRDITLLLLVSSAPSLRPAILGSRDITLNPKP